MKKLYAYLASLKLSVILLVLLLLGLSVGTIVETRNNAEVAGRLVYYSWWFLGLQALFAVNVTFSLVDLFPWAKRRIGFAITHASLILIMLGASLTYFFKVEGQMGMWEGDRASLIEQHDNAGHVTASHQLPFEVKLKDFVLDTYPGLMRPAGFSSYVEIRDLQTGYVFPAKIWMNHPLTYRGYTLFQSSYQQSGGREASVLSVSKDPGQNIAFAGFVTLVGGMIVVLFTRMAQSKEAAAKAALESAKEGGKTALVALLMLGAAFTASAAPTVGTLKRLPIQHDGRTMPFDTVARETVWTVTGSHHWKGQDAAAVMADWTFDPRASVDAPVVKLESKELAVALGLPKGTSHASFRTLVENQIFLTYLEQYHRMEMEGRPRSGVVQDAEKMEKRLLALKAALSGELVRPLPVAGDPMAQWRQPEVISPDMVERLMTGPRLQGWPTSQKIEQEIFYNELNPVRWSWIILAVSLVLSVAAWIKRHRALDIAAFATLLAGFGMMTSGIWLRWHVGDRIPASNMYESLLFLAWGVGLFAVVAFAFLRNRMVVLNAAFMAALTMALTDLLPIDRFIHPMAPVLSGTAWLAIHVPIIMVGYSILALGLVVAHMQIGVTIFAPHRRDMAERMYYLLYWYIFVGSIFLLAGILTGSMWAASSWGRYWGWDPKEVWSLVALLAYMAILHAKLDRMIGKFGVAAISILAFQTILMTYLGVNFVLSTGMHSYGMGDSPVVMWMVLVAVAELAFLGWGLAAYRKQGKLEG
ncbi:MAG: cytochrome c biogenesis protein CcsA [Firmicutes bacterium]|nr:cytochrome c biogenesis protein CcsA [Bacillota bacterium]